MKGCNIREPTAKRWWFPSAVDACELIPSPVISTVPCAKQRRSTAAGSLALHCSGMFGFGPTHPFFGGEGVDRPLQVPYGGHGRYVASLKARHPVRPCDDRVRQAEARFSENVNTASTFSKACVWPQAGHSRNSCCAPVSVFGLVGLDFGRQGLANFPQACLEQEIEADKGRESSQWVCLPVGVGLEQHCETREWSRSYSLAMVQLPAANNKGTGIEVQRALGFAAAQTRRGRHDAGHVVQNWCLGVQCLIKTGKNVYWTSALLREKRAGENGVVCEVIIYFLVQIDKSLGRVDTIPTIPFYATLKMQVSSNNVDAPCWRHSMGRKPGCGAGLIVSNHHTSNSRRL